MSEPPTIAALKALRQAQISGDREGMERARREARAANGRAQGPREKRRRPKGARVHFTTHARQRMAQRNLKAREVYQIWTNGERRPNRHEGMARRWYVRLPSDCAAHMQDLRRFVLVMEEPCDTHPRWALITVLTD